MSIFLRLFGVLVVFFGSAFAQAQKSNTNYKPQSKPEIWIAAQMSYSEERAHFNSLLQAFTEVNSGVNIKVRFFRGDYSGQIYQWLEQGSGPDIIYWYTGKHIERLVTKDYLKDLTPVWEKYRFAESLSGASSDVVTVDGQRYGVPISYYPWALYYRESVLKKFGLTPPNTWTELIESCQTVNENQLADRASHYLGFGFVQKWPILGWFDYLVLRTQGIEFYRDLLNNRADWRGAEVKQVLGLLKQLVEAKCFNPDLLNSFHVDGIVPMLYHQTVITTLAGGYSMGAIAERVKSDFRVMPFPKINEEVPQYTIAPVDAFIVPHYVELDETIQSMLLYLSGSFFQLSLNQPASRMPANRHAQSSIEGNLQQPAIEFIEREAITNFFDRESHPDLAMIVATILVDFLSHQDIQKTLDELEVQTVEFYKNNSVFFSKVGSPNVAAPLNVASPKVASPKAISLPVNSP